MARGLIATVAAFMAGINIVAMRPAVVGVGVSLWAGHVAGRGIAAGGRVGETVVVVVVVVATIVVVVGAIGQASLELLDLGAYN